MKLLALGLVGIKLVSAVEPDCGTLTTACTNKQNCAFKAGNAGEVHCVNKVASAEDVAACKGQLVHSMNAESEDVWTCNLCAASKKQADSVYDACVNKVASEQEVKDCANGQLVHSMPVDKDVWTCNTCAAWKKQGATVYDACQDDADACTSGASGCQSYQQCKLDTKTCEDACETGSTKWWLSYDNPDAATFVKETHCKFNKDACEDNKSLKGVGCTNIQKCSVDTTAKTGKCDADTELEKCSERCDLKKAHFELKGAAECCTEAYNKDEKCTAPKKQTEAQKKTCTDAWKLLSVDANDKCEAWEKDYCDGSMSIAFGMVTFAMMFLF